MHTNHRQNVENDHDLARIALRINAAVSAAVGLLLAAAPATVAGWLGVSIDGWLRLFGLVLIGHALILGIVSTRAEVRRWAQLNVAVVAPYPLLMIAVVVFGLVERNLGVALVLIDGLVIAGVAALHGLGLRQAPSGLHAQAA